MNPSIESSPACMKESQKKLRDTEAFQQLWELRNDLRPIEGDQMSKKAWDLLFVDLEKIILNTYREGWKDGTELVLSIIKETKGNL